MLTALATDPASLLLALIAFAIVLALILLWIAFAPRRVRLDRAELAHLREAALAAERAARDEADRTRGALSVFSDGVRRDLETGRAQTDLRMDAASQSQQRAAEALRSEVTTTIGVFAGGLKSDVSTLAEALNGRIDLFGKEVSASQKQFEAMIGERLAAMNDHVRLSAQSAQDAQNALRKTVEDRLELMRAGNEAKLEQMRATVEEKLQSTLEKRLGESFRLVSERLDTVHRGLGEMHILAAGVGDLKKVLSNVKDRGGWAEMQLGALLDQMLARDQYVVNARVDPSSQETVEFAVKLPGPETGGDVLLPIDAKFPKEDYERLVAAWEGADRPGAQEALDALEKTIELEARKIAEKYIRPPYSTDFAVLYLPTEGLFAEAMRRPGLAARLQAKHKIALAGPTTLAALLTSLQMGFRTLAIQKQTSEVWSVLGAAKSEFQKYALVWEKLSKQLQTAQNTVDDVSRRTRAVTRSLDKVEALDRAEPRDVISMLEPFEPEPAEPS